MRRDEEHPPPTAQQAETPLRRFQTPRVIELSPAGRDVQPHERPAVVGTAEREAVTR